VFNSGNLVLYLRDSDFGYFTQVRIVSIECGVQNNAVFILLLLLTPNSTQTVSISLLHIAEILIDYSAVSPAGLIKLISHGSHVV